MLPNMAGIGSIENVQTIEQPSYAPACLLNLVRSFSEQLLGKLCQTIE